VSTTGAGATEPASDRSLRDTRVAADPGASGSESAFRLGLGSA